MFETKLGIQSIAHQCQQQIQEGLAAPYDAPNSPCFSGCASFVRKAAT